MKLILTPEGLSDPVVECLADTEPLSFMLPCKPVIHILVCLDGKNSERSRLVVEEATWAYYRRLFQKLVTNAHKLVKQSSGLDSGCRLAAEEVEVDVRPISFWDEEENFRLLQNCDLFFMAGFTGGEKHIETMFRDERFAWKRAQVADQVCKNKMTYWGVCGSAVVSGCRWDVEWTTRNMKDCRFFRMLCDDGFVNYISAGSPDQVLQATARH